MATVLIETSGYDVTTTKVMAWLHAWGYTCVRVNEEDPIAELSLCIADSGAYFVMVLKSGIEVDSRSLASYWFRRPAFTTSVPSGFPEPLQRVLEAEWQAVTSAIHDLLLPIHKLGNPGPEQNKPNLVQLLATQRLGIAVPPTLIANTRAALLDFLAAYPSAITKRIEALPQLTHEGVLWAAGGTQLLTPDAVRELDPTFFPALVQSYVEKAFELRIFYLKGNFYPMAILPARGRPPLLDVRQPMSPHDQRLVPYTLPPSWEGRLRSLMEILGLDTASIDAVVTPDDRMVFLEANPVGQLDWLSRECNYHLEEHIARYLAGES